MVSFAPAVKKLSGMSDSTSYFAIAPILTLPLAISLPMACGKYLDSFAYLGADSYQYMFMGCAGLLIICFASLLKTDLTGNQKWVKRASIKNS